MWKEQVNGVLRATTGYQLERPRPQQQARPAKKAAAKPAKSTAPGATSGSPQYDDAANAIIRRVKPRTMTGKEKLFGLISAARYVAQHEIPGHVVECGVWRGGSMQAAALTLLEAGDTHRELHLFDTLRACLLPVTRTCASTAAAPSN